MQGGARQRVAGRASGACSRGEARARQGSDDKKVGSRHEVNDRRRSFKTTSGPDETEPFLSARQITCPLASSIRCMLLRSALSFMGLAASAPALGLTRPQTSMPLMVK